MATIFSILRNIFGYKKVSTNEEQPTSETRIPEPIIEIPVPRSIDWESLVSEITEDGYTLEHLNTSDLRIVAGNKTLTIIYDRSELGLHSFGIYNYCTTSSEVGHKLMAQIISESVDDAYKSLIIESSKDEVWINIADCTNRGAGSYNRLYNQMIDVFEPIILKFIESYVVNNNVGLYVSWGDGTSLGAPLLCQKLKEAGLNIHTAIIESGWPGMKEKFSAATTELTELSCTYKVIQLPVLKNIYDFEGVEEYLRNLKQCSREILLESVAYLKSVIAE